METCGQQEKVESRPKVSLGIFKASAPGPMLSISRNVRLSLGPCVRLCVHFLPPLPEVGCPIFLEIRNPWGKVIEQSGFRVKHFCSEVV